MDKARRITDKKLERLEKEVGRVYRTDPALLQIEKEYRQYMSKVEKKSKDAYKAYINETNQTTKNELKKAYIDLIRSLTIESAEYNHIVKKFVAVMADANQKALDIVNDSMAEIYEINYNQVAVECRKVGIPVDGE